MSVKPNTLFTGDNLYILAGMDSESVDLIYLDPPFNSKRLYKAPIGSKAAGAAFKDMWSWDDVDQARLESLLEEYPSLFYLVSFTGLSHSKGMAAYLLYMAQRLVEMRRVLKPTGSVYLHCDPTASHYLKPLMDMIFGKNKFRNEIVWCYTGPSGGKRNFPAKHDVIFRYTKTDDWVFNPDDVRVPYKSLSTQHGEGGATGGIGGKLTKDTVPAYKSKGKIPEDWWDEMSPVGRIKNERTGYPTQKPLALLDRIIKASSKEGDVVFDPFCGCATTCVSAQNLRRKWIGIDISEVAATLVAERLADAHGKIFTNFTHRSDVPVRTDIKLVDLSVPKTKTAIKKRLYKEQKGICSGCLVAFEARNLDIDHIIPESKGGPSHYDNYQLLCGNCNSIKGNRPMEYLRAKIKARNDALDMQVSFG
ncbi:MAG: HNH endonuclease [Gammaproteobacteria bacterium]|nr:HNH endonuclease [Gammaproteobacteria bacterium]